MELILNIKVAICKINMKFMQSMIVILLFIYIPLANAQTNSKQGIITSYIELDTRETFSMKSIYVNIDGRDFVVFESISDYNFKSISLKIIELNISKNYKLKAQPYKEFSTGKKYNSLAGIAKLKDSVWLYFTVSNSYGSKAILMKARLTSTGLLKDMTKVNFDAELIGGSNPHLNFVDNKYTFAYITAECCDLAYATSDDGISFNTMGSMGINGAMPAIASFDDDALIYNYQRGYRTDKFRKNGKPISVMKSRFIISKDNGNNWGAANIVSDSFDEIHDAFPYKRKDGNIDIYYSHALHRENDNFSLWRRCVNSNGLVGKEELVIGKSMGNIAKPNLYARDDGSTALMFIEQGEDIKNGAIQYFSVIKQDADCHH